MKQKKQKEEKSVYIIKPDCMKHRKRKKIREIILLVGKIISSKVVKLSPEQVDIIYHDLSDEIRQETKRYLCGKYVEIGVVKGIKVIERLVEISGYFTNPRKCEVNSIRYRFAHRVGKKLKNGFIFQHNGFHRSRDDSEVTRDLKVFKML